MAFTSERLLLEGVIPRVSAPTSRLISRRLPYSEPSATIVWKTLYRLGLEKETILWNALQMHPYKGEDTRSNRTPSNSEIAEGAPSLKLLMSAYPDAQLIAIGRKAAGLLQTLGLNVAGAVRHPANGGATQFSEGLAALAAR